jgi:hypothetical protein
MDGSTLPDHSLRMVHPPCASIGRVRRPGVRTLLVLALTVMPVLALPPVARALTVRTLTLEELVSNARTILVGRCVSIREVGSGWAGLPISEAEFAVGELVKTDRPVGRKRGRADAAPAVTGSRTEERVRVRQIAGSAMPGVVPQFEVGQEVLLFLHGEGRTGLTSPVGLAQGIFTIVRMRRGRGADLAVRGYGVPHTTSLGILPQRTAPGGHGASLGPAVELDSLLGAVRRLVDDGR